jgi:hypothetical protein
MLTRREILIGAVTAGAWMQTRIGYARAVQAVTPQ